MAKRTTVTKATPALPFGGPSATPALATDPEVARLSAELAAHIAAIADVKGRTEALNAARLALHAVSPFAAEPVDCVLWVPVESVRGNDYNPNKVAPPEMDLLRRSIHADGYTQPIVAWPVGERQYEVVDGFHRSRCGTEKGPIRERVHGHLPLAVIAEDRTDKSDRIAATIRHNRARGVHGVDQMSDVVRLCYEAGWRDKDIMRELGMEADEVLRLKQITGIAALFKDREFSEAWEACEPDADREQMPEGNAAP